MLTRFWNRLVRALLTVTALGGAGWVQAALPVGAAAPDFTLPAAAKGQAFEFRLATALANGPVVLFFYPKSFTSVCTAEAHAFSEANEKFKALRATVIGVSHDDLETQKKFSVEACRGQFAVAADSKGAVIKLYKAAWLEAFGIAQRLSYVISPQGKVLLAFESSDPNAHVNATLQAVQTWHDAKK